MGELLFRSGIAGKLMDVLDAWLGRVPGRLSLMAVGGGTLFATLGRLRRRDDGAARPHPCSRHVKRGYKQPMTLGPVMGSGGLAVMLPPSALGVILAATADISVGQLLMSIIVPGPDDGGLLCHLYRGALLSAARSGAALSRSEMPLAKKLRDTVVYAFPLADHHLCRLRG